MLNMQSLAEYLDDLASSRPTPGGGAAAALTGAQGIALLSMVCHLTLGKKKFAAIESEIASVLATLEQQRSYLMGLAQQDVQVFQLVMAAYKLPKGTPLEVAARANTIQEALKAASKIPFDLFISCLKMLPLADRLEKIANPSVLSDVVVGRYLLFAGLLGAKTNVDVNLVGITDEVFCREKRDYMQRALAGLPWAYWDLSAT